jgi:hypothetical protein
VSTLRKGEYDVLGTTRYVMTFTFLVSPLTYPLRLRKKEEEGEEKERILEKEHLLFKKNSSIVYLTLTQAGR